MGWGGPMWTTADGGRRSGINRMSTNANNIFRSETENILRFGPKRMKMDKGGWEVQKVSFWSDVFDG